MGTEEQHEPQTTGHHLKYPACVTKRLGLTISAYSYRSYRPPPPQKKKIRWMSTIYRFQRGVGGGNSTNMSVRQEVLDREERWRKVVMGVLLPKPYIHFFFLWLPNWNNSLLYACVHFNGQFVLDTKPHEDIILFRLGDWRHFSFLW